MKKFLAWGIALALIISMGIAWFVNYGCAKKIEEEPVDWECVLDWYYNDHKIWAEDYDDFEVKILSVSDYGSTYVEYMLLEDDGSRFLFDLKRVDWIKELYDEHHIEKG